MADAELLLAWRNDPETRRFSRDQRDIPEAEHYQWLAKTSVLLAEQDGMPVGTCRVDSDGWVSLTVAPERRGKGYGRVMLRQLILGSLGTLFASVHAANVASLIVFLKNGFVLDRVQFQWPWFTLVLHR